MNERREREREGRDKEGEKKWQKQGKKLFQEYAVPAIKAEGTKYLTKRFGEVVERVVKA